MNGHPSPLPPGPASPVGSPLPPDPDVVGDIPSPIPPDRVSRLQAVAARDER